MKLPVVSGVEVVKALRKIGYELDHQTKPYDFAKKGTAISENNRFQTIGR
jgi:hypothetical protein